MNYRGSERGSEGSGERQRWNWGNEGRDYGREYSPQSGPRWGSQEGRFGREGSYGTQGGRDWQQEDRGWDRGWDRGREWQGSGGFQRGGNWEGEFGNEQQYGRKEQQYGRNDWSDRYGSAQREMFGGRGSSSGMGTSGQHSGRGPRNYKRSDQRIEEDINEQLTRHGMIDATEIEVAVQNGEVTLRGHVDNRDGKRMAEDIAESVYGVKDVNNQIKVKQQRGQTEENKQDSETSGKRERKVS